MDLTANQFSDNIDDWETDLDTYGKQTCDHMSDAITVAVILKHALCDVQAALRLQLPTIHDDYNALRTTVQLLARGFAEYTSRGNVAHGGNDVEVAPRRQRQAEGRRRRQERMQSQRQDQGQ